MQGARGRLLLPLMAVVQRDAIFESLCGVVQEHTDLCGGLTVQIYWENGAGDCIFRETVTLLVAELCNEDIALFEQGLDDARRLHPSLARVYIRGGSCKAYGRVDVYESGLLSSQAFWVK